MSIRKILMSIYSYDKIYRGGYMVKERKAITLRVSSELKFQIDKAVLEDGDSTINAWLIKIIKQHLENSQDKKNRGSK
jgi:hypothetical protein